MYLNNLLTFGAILINDYLHTGGAGHEETQGKYKGFLHEISLPAVV